MEDENKKDEDNEDDEENETSVWGNKEAHNEDDEFMRQ